MIVSDCKVSLFFCLIFVLRLYSYLRIICAYRPHHACGTSTNQQERFCDVRDYSFFIISMRFSMTEEILQN